MKIILFAARARLVWFGFENRAMFQPRAHNANTITSSCDHSGLYARVRVCVCDVVVPPYWICIFVYFVYIIYIGYMCIDKRKGTEENIYTEARSTETIDDKNRGEIESMNARARSALKWKLRTRTQLARVC